MIHQHQPIQPPYALGGDPPLDAWADKVDRLVATWLAPMRRMDWRQRLELLEEIDRLLVEQMDAHPARLLSQAFTAQLLHRLGAGAVEGLDQAWMYLNSADEAHALRARAWLAGTDTPLR